MYQEDDFVPISGLQHLLFCERQCALIHVERLWEENLLTIEGRHLHEKIDEAKGETRDQVRIAYHLPLHSPTFGLLGKADVVEFHPTQDSANSVQFGKIKGIPKILRTGNWRPFPVEYKRGKPKLESCDEVQLCAQALCLEDMFQIQIPAGALFYGKTQHRYDVAFDTTLRTTTTAAIQRLHEIIHQQIVPKASYQKCCEQCSLIHICLPKHIGTKSAKRYLAEIFRQA